MQRELIQVGYNASFEGHAPLAGYAFYYRNQPIILNMSPQWPGAPHHSVRFEGGILWEQLEAAGVACDGPKLAGYGWRTLSFRDPDGHGITLQHPVSK